MATFSICRIAPKHHRMLFVLLALSLSCVAVPAAEPPAWWNDPIKEDPGNYFFTATGASAASFDAALQEAQKNALDQIVARVGGPPDAKEYLLGRVRGWKVHARDDKKQGRLHHVWIILKYPKDESEKLRKLAAGGDQQYETAVRLAGERQWQQALAILDNLEKQYPLTDPGRQSLFRTEKAVLLAGQCYEGMDQFQKAKDTYERLLNTVSDASVRKAARTTLERARRKLPDEVIADKTVLSRTAILDLLAAQDYMKALSMAELFLEKDGQTPEALELIARSYAGAGNLDTALQYYTLAARSASPAMFRIVRVKAQNMASQVLATRCVKTLAQRQQGKGSWALLVDPALRDNPDIAAFIRSFQSAMARAELNMQQKDWLLLEEWIRATGKKCSDLLTAEATLKAACTDAGVEDADLILLLDRGPGSNKAKVVVRGTVFEAMKPTAVTVDVIVSQAVAQGATMDSALNAIAEERLDEAANMFEQMGKKPYSLMLRDAALLRRACRSLTRGSTITPDIREDFERSIRAISASANIWLPQSETDKQVSELLLAAVRRWIDAVEADFAAVGGNKRDLIAVLNRCREFDKAMGLLPLGERQPNAVQAYAEYAEKYRTCPFWAISKGIWIDADTGFSIEVEDRQFEIPFRFVPGGETYFGEARQSKRVELTGFYVQARETTNKDFLRFCDERGWQIPEHLIRNTGFGQPEQPVTHVTQLDAMRYAQWLGIKFRGGDATVKWKCELPSEAQWEAACRSMFPFDYPWGLNAKPTASLAQRKLGAPEGAARLAEDISICDVMGLGGNVREWCRDGWTDKPVETITPGAKNPVLGVQWDTRRVVKGGCYFSERASDFAVHSRRAFEPENVERSLGFRVVVNMMSKE
jgi:formylglycine-generating enzyme required for sulfatase activity/tetratricopeptide (TPR) repeat protein